MLKAVVDAFMDDDGVGDGAGWDFIAVPAGVCAVVYVA
jgi:hypothetical protein